MYLRPVPLATVERLSVYLRTLEKFLKLGETHISSSTIAEQNGYTPAQVRKDLTCFGSFGRKGQGYPIEELIEHIRNILGITTDWNICIVGYGNLGSALAQNVSLNYREFKLKAVFDINEKLIGRDVWGIKIQHEREIEETISREGIQIGVVTVPENSAERVMRNLAKAGVNGILNFTSVRIPPLDGVFIKDVNIGGHLETISFYLTNPGMKC
jgi:redox-sensing transcriptional repressor